MPGSPRGKRAEREEERLVDEANTPALGRLGETRAINFGGRNVAGRRVHLIRSCVVGLRHEAKIGANAVLGFVELTFELWIAGLVGIAAAPDFTKRMQWPKLTPEQQATVMSQGYVQVPSNYEDDYIFTKALFDDGDANLLLEGEIDIDVPMTLLHGQEDADVPVEISFEIARLAKSSDVVIELVKSADHRFSGPEELERLARAVAVMTEKVS